MTVPIELEVVTAQRVAVAKTRIKEVYIPAFKGKAGILENHLPYISLLEMGEISYLDLQGRRHYLYIEEGFVESADNKISIVSDFVEKAQELDEKEIRSAYETVTQKIKSSLKGEITPKELEEALQQEKKLKVKIDILDKMKG